MAQKIAVVCLLGAMGLLVLPGCGGKDDASPENAEATLKKVEEHIKAEKLDDAAELLKKLEANKGKYEKALQDKIVVVRKALDAAIAAKKITPPALPGS